MNISEYLTLLSIIIPVVISVIGAIYKISTDTKKFELSEYYTKELLDWYEKTIFSIKKIKLANTDENKNVYLAELSSLIDVGRFYFPNIIKNDGYGEDKPEAFKGHRHISLEFLVWIYDLLNYNDYNDVKQYVDFYERQFTSIIFSRLKPHNRNKHYSKYTNITLSENTSARDFFDKWHYDTYSETFKKVK